MTIILRSDPEPAVHSTDVTDYWDGGFLKVFRGVVDMTPDDGSGATVHPTMTHFFYMDEKDDTKVRHWVGAVGPVSLG